MEKLEQNLSELEDLFGVIIKTQENFKKCPKARLTRGYIEAKLQMIDQYWDSFRSAHTNLLKTITKEQRKQLPYFTQNHYYTCEELIIQTKADLKDLLTTTTVSVQKSPVDTDQSTMSIPQVKLPRISLPKFSGSYEEWPTFQDLFISLVHQNNSLDGVQKLQYLKASVIGEAESLLKHVQITEANYTNAWEALTNRYSNKRLIVTSILKRLCNQKKLLTQSANNIKSLLDTTNECLNSLKNLGMDIDNWDPLVIFIVVQKFDADSHKEWEEYVSQQCQEDLPKLSHLSKFLETRFRTLELLHTPKERITIRERACHVAAVERICLLCNGTHALYHCKDFGKMEPSQRADFVKAKPICFNCLVSGHSVKSCRLITSCKICHRRHHTLLHQSQRTKVTFNQSSDNNQLKVSSHSNVEDLEEVRTNTVMTSQTQATSKGVAMLATALVTVKSEEGHATVLRALIDPGSQGCFISERAVQALNAKRHSVQGNIVGVGSVKTRINQVVQIEVLSRHNDFSLTVRAYVISKQLTTEIPTETIISHDWPHLNGIILADTNFYKPSSIDLLLGVNEYATIIQNDIIKGPPGSPCAQKTTLGWILFGQVSDHSENQESMLVMHHQIDVEDMLKKLWEIDTDKERKLTRDERMCEKIYVENYTRNSEGRYIVKLPFNTEEPISPEGNTKEIAMKRLQQLHRRFERNPELKTEYHKVMDEYIAMGHMEEVTEEELSNSSVYLPHHAVVRSEKETTKTRVVFDASCKGTNGLSLNDELMVGPILQEDLRSVIMRWRMHKICFVSDIEKMYRMILLHKEDTDFQRVLWTKNTSKSDDVKDYRLLTVTFGTASAPYLAIRTLFQLANDECENYPHTSRILKEDFVVDDVLSGGDTVSETIKMSEDLQIILAKAGFKLQKWSSNDVTFLKSKDPKEITKKAILDLKIEGTIKALGITWDMGADEFSYQFKLERENKNHTKRTILSDLQKLFDPLGWIAPVIVSAKILVQKLWLERVDWDEQINENLEEEWTKIRSDLEEVTELKLKRWMNTINKEREQITVHGFCDASIRAYAAVVYCRVETAASEHEISLVAAKTRVAPIKPISLPRLELCGALLLSKLMLQVGVALRIPKESMYAWTDSEIVLSWLSGNPNRWKTFVANRVSEIVDNLNYNQWHHVISAENPADIATRGTTVTELKGNNLWWRGPEWLSKTIVFKEETIQPTTEEIKIIATNHMVNLEGKEEVIKFENYSTLNEMLRIIANCRKFIQILRHKNEVENATTPKELDEALNICVRIVQGKEYNEEIQRLKDKKIVSNKSNLKLLNPFIDENNILRVGGRLRHANLTDYSKHPVILGNKNELVKLIVADAHLKTLHGGVQLMMCYLRSKYWIIRAKGLVKKHIHKCLICARQRATPMTQMMGDLPRERVTPTRAFLNSGVDFAGPFQILLNKGRGAKVGKAYISIFVCMATKAVHLELVGDLTSESFIGAFKRFVARRGKCSHLWSDQGRNFVGADKELLRAWEEANFEFKGKITESLASDGTEWHFIPAYSPHFGGLWEAGVKSIKHHLKRILTTNLTFEEMTTILCQIEACLNSRPLCPIDDNDTDVIQPLTPGHFLIGETPMVVPSPNLQHLKCNNLSRWQYTQKLLGDFWKRWQDEYLTRLQQRPKWLKNNQDRRPATRKMVIRTCGRKTSRCRWTYQSL